MLVSLVWYAFCFPLELRVTSLPNCSLCCTKGEGRITVDLSCAAFGSPIRGVFPTVRYLLHITVMYISLLAATCSSDRPNHLQTRYAWRVSCGVVTSRTRLIRRWIEGCSSLPCRWNLLRERLKGCKDHAGESRTLINLIRTSLLTWLT